MKAHRFFAIVLCLFLCGQLARAQDMDSALTKLSEDVAAKIKENGNKKVTVLDFTDLEGGSSELGKYIAEQLTVDFVMTKRDFSVLDRANQKRILAEHKLSVTGLVSPENAKALGTFSGVDAMLFGTIAVVGKSVNVTVKIIATENNEVVGGAKARFQTDENIDKMLSQTTKAADGAGANEGETKPAPTKPSERPFGELQAKVELVKLLPGENGDTRYGEARMTLVISNTSETITYGIAVDDNLHERFNLSNDRGDIFITYNISGLEMLGNPWGEYRGKVTEIPPKTGIRVVTKHRATWNGKVGEYRPFHFQTEFLFCVESQGRYGKIKKYNFISDIN